MASVTLDAAIASYTNTAATLSGTIVFLGGTDPSATLAGGVFEANRVRFQVTQHVLVTKISTKSNVLVVGALIGIASNFSGTSTVPWLGKGVINIAGSSFVWSTFVLDTPVELVPGVDYCFTCTFGLARTPADPASYGVVTLFSNPMLYGSNYNKAFFSDTTMFGLVGSLDTAVNPSAVISGAGAVVGGMSGGHAVISLVAVVVASGGVQANLGASPRGLVLLGEVGASLDSATLILHGVVQSEDTVRPDVGTEAEQVTPLIPYYV